jgi:CubicO group peptidase (beta-lactamase class C family)
MTSKTIFTALLLLLSNSVKSQDLSFIQKQIDSVYVKGKLIGGILVGILDKDKRSFYTTGYAVPDDKTLFDSKTIVEIGSITKTFTAYVLLQVLKENNINENTSIIPYLPDSMQVNESLRKITFLNLMNHTAGLPRVPSNMVFSQTPYDNYELRDLYSFLKKYEVISVGKCDYSNLGFGLAGVLAAQISGKPYQELLQKYIFKPFGMLKKSKISQKAQGYFDGEKSAFWNMNCLAPAGGVQCSADDMLSYLSNISIPKNKSLVDSLTSQTVSINKRIQMGRGWHIYTAKNGNQFYWHNGGTFGFSTFTAFSKNTNKGFFMVLNEYNKNQILDVVGFKLINSFLNTNP